MVTCDLNIELEITHKYFKIYKTPAIHLDHILHKFHLSTVCCIGKASSTWQTRPLDQNVTMNE